MERNSPIVTVIDDRKKTKQTTPPLIIHDEVDRKPSDSLYYSMKLVSGRKNRYGKIGISEYHLTISSKPPKEADHCYAFSPAALFFGDQIEIKLFKYTGKDDNLRMSKCAFLDKEKLKDRR